MTQETALTILKTGKSVFLTGAPGSGKTHTLNTYIGWLERHGVAPSITASTGIAATHLGGTTIHSWSGVGVREFMDSRALDSLTQKQYLHKRIEKAKVLIIDEISMLQASYLDMVEMVCREIKGVEKPFGGLQVIVSGDFFQLPPVMRSYQEGSFAFEAQSWKALDPIVCYLSSQHRAEDDLFLNILHAIRAGETGEAVYEHLRRTYLNTFEEGVEPVRLETHNRNVDSFNIKKLAELEGKEVEFEASSKGSKKNIEQILKRMLSPEVLKLKKGARVVCTKNDQHGKYVNGTLGVVDHFSKSGSPVIKTQNGDLLDMSPVEFELKDEDVVRARVSQIPLRLAWALTVHKSQGMTLDAAEINLSGAFTPGQGYVALSRVRTLSTLRLTGLNQNALMVHPTVSVYDTYFRERALDAQDMFESVPKDELKHVQESFLVKIGGTLTEISEEDVQKKKEPKEKVPTTQKTLDILTEGKTVTEAAAIRGIKLGSVLAHLEVLSFEDKIKEEWWQGYMEDLDVSNDDISVVRDLFLELEEENLAPIFQHFDGEYTYDQIRFIRAYMKKDEA